MFDEEINWVEPYKFRNFKEVRNKGDFVKIVKDAQLPGKLNSKTIGKIETIGSVPISVSGVAGLHRSFTS